MKFTELFLFLLCFVFVHVSCEKQPVLDLPTSPLMTVHSSEYQNISFIEAADIPDEAILTFFTKDSNDQDDNCSYGDCTKVIREAHQYYQSLANQLCQNVYTEVICCADGFEAYAFIIVRPDSLCMNSID